LIEVASDTESKEIIEYNLNDDEEVQMLELHPIA